MKYTFDINFLLCSKARECIIEIIKFHKIIRILLANWGYFNANAVERSVMF